MSRLTTKQLAAEYSVSEATIRRWAAAGRLPVDRAGDSGNLLFDRDACLRALNGEGSVSRRSMVDFVCHLLATGPDAVNASEVIDGLKSGSITLEDVMSDLGYSVESVGL